MLLAVSLFLGWILILLLLRKLKIYFFIFVIGSVGLFFLLMYVGKDYLEKTLEYAVTYCMWLIGNKTGLFTAYPDYSLITSYFRREAVSFFVDYECSGFIEILVYICLLAFYPVYKIKGKILLSFVGIVYIFISNVIRVFIICTVIKLLGPSVFFFSHTIIARVLFFTLTVTLYYVVFTRPHILLQKVGNLTYDS